MLFFFPLFFIPSVRLEAFYFFFISLSFRHLFSSFSFPSSALVTSFRLGYIACIGVPDLSLLFF